jgi:radical SAM protein with 4Fe4S-binding SPASM domain
MKAKIKPRIDLEKRTRLETVIPLATPFIVFVDPSDTCNFQCKFCPTGDRKLMRRTTGRNHGPMDFGLYQKIIADIGAFSSPLKVLRLYKDGEPLMNPRFVDMVRYARDSGCCERIDTTINASLLSKEKIDGMIEAGLTRINISIEGMNAGQYERFSSFKINFERLVDNIAYLYVSRRSCEIIIKINGDILSEEDIALFYKTFGDIADGISVEHVMSCWPEFALKDVKINEQVGIYGQAIKEVQVCPYIFYSISVNSDGTVSACFLDWERRIVAGDIKTQTLKDVWLSDKMNALRRMMLEKKRGEHPVCRRCSQLSHGMPDDLDAFTDELRNKF